MHALEIKNLIKTYATGVQAVKGIDLTVEQGDFYALLGHNGAGKSTTIGIISSLVNKTSGSVKVFGYDLDTQKTQLKQQIGLVPQEFTFNQFEKVLDVLTQQAGFYGIPLKEAKVRAEMWLKKLDLWEKRTHLTRELSGGMKRRVMIARALMHNPKLLILDEPFSGFDPVNANLIKDQILDLKAQGTTIILSTHRMESVEELCDSVALVHQSRKVLDGRISEVKEKFKQNLFEITLSEASLDAFNSFKTKNELFNEKLDENFIHFEIKNSMSQRELLQELLNIGKIVEFKEKIPTMNEVFIAAVKGI